MKLTVSFSYIFCRKVTKNSQTLLTLQHFSLTVTYLHFGHTLFVAAQQLMPIGECSNKWPLQNSKSSGWFVFDLWLPFVIISLSLAAAKAVLCCLPAELVWQLWLPANLYPCWACLVHPHSLEIIQWTLPCMAHTWSSARTQLGKEVIACLENNTQPRG